jgi:hypothetical protein
MTNVNKIAVDINKISHKSYEKYDLRNPRHNIKLEIVPNSIEKSPSGSFSDIRHNQVTYKFADGRSETVTRSFEHKVNQDVADVVAYYKENDNLYICVTDTIRPAVAVRHLISDKVLPQESGIVTNLPGQYFRNEVSIEECVREVVTGKLGLKLVDGKLENIGGTYFPSIGGSLENCVMSAVLVEKPEFLSAVAIGERHEAYRKRFFLTPQNIIDGFLKEEIKDLRLVLAAFRLAHAHNIKITINSELKKGQVFDLNQNNCGLEFVNLDSFDQWNAVDSENLDSPLVISVDENNIEVSKSFITDYRVVVEAINNKGEVIGDSFFSDVTVRKNIDTVATSGHCFIKEGDKESLKMLINLQWRAALIAREFTNHPIHQESIGLRAEGVAESLNSTTSDKTKILSDVIKGINEEGGVEATSDCQQYLGAGYASSGTSTELGHFCLVSIDPTKPSNAMPELEEAVKRGLIDVDDVIELCQQGKINEPRIEILAYFLKASYNYEKNKNNIQDNFTRDERSEFNSIINSGSFVDLALQNDAREINSELNKYEIYRKLKRFCENELGVVLQKVDNQLEALAFDNFIPIFLYPPLGENDIRMNAFYILHDLFHYASGGILPFARNEDGSIRKAPDNTKPILLEYANYESAMIELECAAVWFSDVCMPKLLGYEKSREIFRSITIGEALENLGVEYSDTFTILKQIESTGAIPEQLKQHKDYDKYEAVLEERLIGLYKRDKENVKRMYDGWVNQPEVAEVVARFYEQALIESCPNGKHIDKLCSSLDSYPEGYNGLKAKISRTINFDIRRTALALKFYQGLVNQKDANNKIIHAIDTTIDKLHKAQLELVAIKSQVVDTNPTFNNLEAFRKWKRISNTVIKDARMLELRLQNSEELIGASNVALYKDRILPAMTILDFENPKNETN